MNDDALHAAGSRALDRFIETFNSRDAHAWAGSLSYPHVRVSSRRAVATVLADAKEYAARASYDAADAMGWHHSAWDTKQLLAVSPTKIHASAQWCRYNAAGDRILPNNVSYVITEVGGRWGIQGRFGVDSAAPEDPLAAVGRATAAWDRLSAAAGRGDVWGVGGAVRLPVYLVGIGGVTVAATPEEVLAPLGECVAQGTAEVVALQVGRLGVNLGVQLRTANGENCHALVLVVLDPGGPRVSAVSLLREAQVLDAGGGRSGG